MEAKKASGCVFLQREIQTEKLNIIKNRIMETQNTILDIEYNKGFKRYEICELVNERLSGSGYIFNFDIADAKLRSQKKVISTEITHFFSLLIIDEIDPGNLYIPDEIFFSFPPKRLFEWVEIYLHQGGKVSDNVIRNLEEISSEIFRKDSKEINYMKREVRIKQIKKINGGDTNEQLQI